MTKKLSIYLTLYLMIRRFDQEDRFDANGRNVPKHVMKLQAKLRDGEELLVADRTWVHSQLGLDVIEGSSQLRTRSPTRSTGKGDERLPRRALSPP